MKIEAKRIGQYELRQRLNQDNSSETWQAYDTVTRATIILKFYRTDLLETTDALAGYLQNIERIAALHHPNVVHIHNIQVIAPGTANNPTSLVCLATEYIKGRTLADYMHNATGKIPPATEIVQLFSTLAIAVDNAHQHDLIHGNLKPSNVLLKQSENPQDGPGIPVLTDFAASKALPKKAGNELPFYLAPEQIRGDLTDRRSDVYALGALLYELYTGQLPFRGNRPIAVMMQHVNALPTSPDLIVPGISPAVAQIILRCLAKNPQERFPNATSVAIALANAYRLAVPENLRRFASLYNLSVVTEFPNAQPVGTLARSEVLNDKPLPPGQTSFPSSSRKKGNRFLLILITISLVAIIGASFGIISLKQRMAGATSGGQAFFLNSGQLNATSSQGLNDEVQIDLTSLPKLPADQSYYAWLLGDLGQNETLPLLIDRLTPKNGSVHITYDGDPNHDNLLATNSRFLITVDSTQNPSSNPLLDQSTWRYYAVLPQTPDPADPLHFSMLDHLRHLLVESPELTVRGLHGGLAFWFVRDTATVSALANALAGDWQQQNAKAIHEQVLSVLDYLDGTSYIDSDVPAGTPFLGNRQITQVALLGPAQQNMDPPGYVYQDEPPPGYIYLIQSHLNGAVLSPQATSAQHQLAIQINKSIDSTRKELMQIYTDVKQLLQMTDSQLLQPSTAALLNTVATQAQNAYTGQPNPATGTSQTGALWIYNNLQRLATFDITPYAAK